jgi:hypothetical protein
MTPRRPKAGFADDFRRFFVRGLAALLPTLITLWLLIKIWDFLWDSLGQCRHPLAVAELREWLSAGGVYPPLLGQRQGLHSRRWRDAGDIAGLYRRRVRG